MKGSAILPVVSLVLFLAGCVPAYVEPPRAYEPTPPVIEVPVLPPTVILEDRPYYAYGGHYYYWDNDRDIWLYSRSNRGPWFQLPKSHYPGRFQYRGRWHEGGRDDDRDRGRGRERER